MTSRTVQTNSKFPSLVLINTLWPSPPFVPETGHESLNVRDIAECAVWLLEDVAGGTNCPPVVVFVEDASKMDARYLGAGATPKRLPGVAAVVGVPMRPPEDGVAGLPNRPPDVVVVEVAGTPKRLPDDVAVVVACWPNNPPDVIVVEVAGAPKRPPDDVTVEAADAPNRPPDVVAAGVAGGPNKPPDVVVDAVEVDGAPNNFPVAAAALVVGVPNNVPIVAVTGEAPAAALPEPNTPVVGLKGTKLLPLLAIGAVEEGVGVMTIGPGATDLVVAGLAVGEEAPVVVTAKVIAGGLVVGGTVLPGCRLDQGAAAVVGVVVAGVFAACPITLYDPFGNEPEV